MTRRLRRLRPPLPPLDIPEAGKPLAEMTGAERSAYLGKLRRALRDHEVRSGTRRPTTLREMEISREGEAEREAWRAGMIAEIARRQQAQGNP